jgi:tripeptidyl-peptidase-1
MNIPFLLSLLCVASAQLITTHAPKEYVGDWKAVKQANDKQEVYFTIVMQEQNLDVVKEYVLKVSDPDSPSYGEFFTQQQLDALTMPNQVDFDRVLSWLKSYGIQYNQQHNNIMVTCTVAEASKLLNTQFNIMVSESQGIKIVKAGDYKIPIGVQFSIKTIFGLHGIPMPYQKPIISISNAGRPAAITPAVINKIYSVTGVNVTRSLTNRQAVAEFQGQLMSQSDLTTFFNKYVYSAKSGDDQVYKYVGAKKEKGDGVEALLDIEFIMGVAAGVKTEFWEWAGNDFCHDLNQWSSEILSESDVPLVHSVSYGWQGKLSQIGCNDADRSTIEDNLAKIAAKGISVLFASGDSGSGYTKDFFKGAALYPSWPASSPWVTAVGATRFVDQKVGQPEMATDQFGSGGGFSDDFAESPHAEYQKSFVQTFFSTAPQSGLPPANMYNATGRGTPDVSAVGEGYQVIVDGQANSVGGTSASTPAFAGIVSLLNEARAKKGKKPLGFLNPFLYKNAHAFTDVTRGSNKIDRSGSKVPDGWDCVKGWDPATGLGTPKFSKLLLAALALK